ncbi:MAG: carbamoyltransferase HypF [Thermoleophilia bacterium]
MRCDGDSPRDSAFRVRVTGAVQGVGFRPFVHALATSLSLAGRVRNDPFGVEIVVEGPPATLEAFVRRLVDDAPPLSLVEAVTAEKIEPAGMTGFSIAQSSGGAHSDTYVTADAATCPDCLRELFDPCNRRYRYPFINCTACGPRYTITRAIPYDRPSTTMASFRMCPECQREYDDPCDRRFHAQPNACPVCGPRLTYHTAGRADAHGEAALASAVDVLLEGGIIAVKGLGGYHLACDATRETSVAALRLRKHRDERPFAVMAGTLEDVAAHCSVSQAEAELLSSPRRPIVLLDRAYPRPAAAGEASRGAPSIAHDALAPSVAPGVDTHGFFLPYTPLHHLLLHAVGRPLVMTSGNVSDEPIAFEDRDAFSRLRPLADGFLTHDRPIHVRVDDSVARALDGRPYLVRRSRGWAPLPVSFPGSDTCILAVGGHLKNTFVVTRGRRAFVSQHIGDLENLETLRSLEEGVAHFQRLFDLRPAMVAHDLHPDYLSTRFAGRIAAEHSLTIVGVQHHEAHVASVLADAGHPGPVVGVAFDGTGYGTDGTVWGGEFFVGSPGALTRVARLGRLPLPGGEAAIREPWRLGLALLQVCGIDPEAALAPVANNGVDTLLSRSWEFMARVIEERVNTPLTSSAGRLFDAIAALLSLRLEVSYEGQAAILLETAARRHFATTGLPSAATTPDWLARDGWPAATRPDLSPRVIPLQPFAHALVHDLARGDRPSQIAARFHHALAWVTAEEAAVQAAHHSLDTVALGGGVFQNMLLVQLLMDRLRRLGLDVLTHRNVPTNDGGLSLGQAATAAAVLQRGAPAPTGHEQPSATSTPRIP